jgi:DNA-binding IclR family transcriptional regulator
VVSAIINTMKIDAALLKRLSKLRESGISIRDISDQLGMDQQTTIRLLRLLGYNTGVLEETWLIN